MNVILLPVNKRIKQLIRAHGDVWEVMWSCRMPCFDGSLGLAVRSLDGTHERNVRASDTRAFFG